MRLLVTSAHPTLLKYPQEHLGRLVQPRHYSSVQETAASGMVWAADNDAYNDFDPMRFYAMLDRFHRLPDLGRCKFVACPDVVGDWRETARLFRKWAPALARRGLPIGLVAQDGLAAEWVPWREIDALFIGGTTEYKMSAEAAVLVAEAKSRGLWTHMGRVNSWRRIVYARSIGCDSADGSSFAVWRDTHLPRNLEWLSNAGQQLPLAQECGAGLSQLKPSPPAGRPDAVGSSGSEQTRPHDPTR